ncbi:TMhelix containing protein [Vibrio phage 1.152.O._10N.222.46.E1]|uniref:TMhelix containing protein n=4 Tax=Nahantvirus 49C7 TaxID=2846601 RepID=A0A2I7RBG9_9CAUD|nr:TMhelix containing protein [Vibrio phage 1.025.O._10N.222.46.B6]AUR90798.1 TMhelix containing protein [Vibrio phage 1.150.O._10N.222.46.A6]AUR90971.1 TMhelix containing protein [Vibrio phage 1.152.O._10N.222.46.E1]AUS02439.1 TMhelix containing protein [Vibrio phage 2.130.O._10N.222.46.C2]
MGTYLIIAVIYAVVCWALSAATENPVKWPNVALGAVVWPLSLTLLVVMGLLLAIGINSESIDIVAKTKED